MKALAAAGAIVLALALSACTSSTDGSAGERPSASSSPVEVTTGTTSDPSADPDAVPLPDDCRAILSDDVLDQLADYPLNDPAFGDSGVQDDGSLLCIWGDPAADTTVLSTTISHATYAEGKELLDGLASDDGFTCYESQEGTRCEKTWQNDTYPVTDGRTVFWREGVLIDTRYSNLAPDGYTASIVDHVFS